MRCACNTKDQININDPIQELQWIRRPFAFYVAGTEGFASSFGRPKTLGGEWCYNFGMSEAARLTDIDGVIGIVKEFMSEGSNQFTEVNKILDTLDRKCEYLINTIDDFLSRIDKYETENPEVRPWKPEVRPLADSVNANSKTYSVYLMGLGVADRACSELDSGYFSAVVCPTASC